ncbi:hypothetical protein C8034_v001942 [Colletotrichum sidae]|uniref:Uncharacterized protein n=1 Tax=Colletotrichum sidae TaxID=1347389 RepID=A0A4R8TD02_9PEZI|nr:hypothetical protein C8034_v001942 [Colletotrichum sidae]
MSYPYISEDNVDIDPDDMDPNTYVEEHQQYPYQQSYAAVPESYPYGTRPGVAYTSTQPPPSTYHTLSYQSHHTQHGGYGTGGPEYSVSGSSNFYYPPDSSAMAPQYQGVLSGVGSWDSGEPTPYPDATECRGRAKGPKLHFPNLPGKSPRTEPTERQGHHSPRDDKKRSKDEHKHSKSSKSDRKPDKKKNHKN